MYDVLIVGAGPAGTNVAVRLAKEGYRVALVDWRSFPRDKTCGDALISDAICHLKKIGVYNKVAHKAHAIRHITVFGSGENSMTIGGPCLTLRRIDLDLLLQREAINAGAQFYVGKINRLEQVHDHVVAHFMDGRAPLRARYAVVATGSDVSLLRSLGMVRQVTPGALAVRGYFRSAVLIENLVISFHKSIPNGYGWIFPMGKGEYNVGCGYFYPIGKIKGPDPRQLLTSFLQNFDLGRDLLSHGDWVSPIKGAPLRCGLNGTDLIRGRVVATGEAIATTFPFTGEGIGKAMETGFEVGGYVDLALQKNSPEFLTGYTDYVAQLRHKYLVYHIAQRFFRYKFILDSVIKSANSNPRLCDLAQGVLNESIDLKNKLTFRRMCKLFFFRR